jgi:hypothetical protein
MRELRPNDDKPLFLLLRMFFRQRSVNLLRFRTLVANTASAFQLGRAVQAGHQVTTRDQDTIDGPFETNETIIICLCR